MKNKTLLYLFMALILSSIAIASNFELELKPIKDAIAIDEEAEFEAYITNNGMKDDFKVYYDGIEWYVKPESFSLEHGETKILDMKARPLYVSLGQFAIPIKAKASSDKKVDEKDLIINIKDEASGNYLPSVSVKTDIAEEITPNNNLKTSITLKNKNPLNLEDLTFIVESKYFYEEKKVSLSEVGGDLATETFDLEFELDDNLPPQKITIDIKLTYENTTLYTAQKIIEIKEYDPDLLHEKETSSSFFKTVADNKLKNIGNVRKQKQLRVPISLFKELFTSEIPKASLLRQEGDRYLVWDVDLEPGEEMNIKVITNFRPLLLAILIIALLIVVYFVVRSPLVITKHAKVLKFEEGGISMLQIMITLRNISEKPIKNLEVYDTIPHLAEYVKEEHIGSLAPSKVLNNEKKGTMLKWDVENFEGFEERIITYKIRTHLKILGGLTLPSCSGKFLTRRGKKLFAKSKDLKLILNSKKEN